MSSYRRGIPSHYSRQFIRVVYVAALHEVSAFASAVIATSDCACVSIDLHDLGIHLLGDTFRHRDLPSVSYGCDPFSDCRGSALHLDAFERRSAYDPG